MEACIEYAGRRDDEGYGRIGKGQGAHRVAWEEVYGPIPRGLIVHHVCENPPCVNAEHLMAVTRREHKLLHAPLDCKNGHPFDEANTYWRPNGRRFCRRCGIDANRRYRARKAAA